MGRMTWLECMDGAIRAAVNEDPDAALAALTGHFVGLLTALTDARGHDAECEIRIDGGECRDITLHAAKAPAAQGDAL